MTKIFVSANVKHLLHICYLLISDMGDFTNIERFEEKKTCVTPTLRIRRKIMFNILALV